MSQRMLSHFALYALEGDYWPLPAERRSEFRKEFPTTLRAAAQALHVYQVFPTRAEADFLVWSTSEAGRPEDAAAFFRQYAGAVGRWRHLVRPTLALWGFTKPSQYASGRSAQEIDPLSPQRSQYLIVYPFVKTTAWYLMSRDARQGMMNEHIRMGHQYPEVKQLLLYSSGLQDQEFVVVYETDDLARFSDLVAELRGSEARRYTERDTPITTAMFHPGDEALALWE